jgi:hypothetical protein
VLAEAAILMTALVGILAVCLDGGILLIQRRHIQAMSDAAALAAASVLYQRYSTDNGLDPSNYAQSRAVDIATHNGYTTTGGAYQDLTANLKDSSGNPVYGIFIPPATQSSPFYNKKGYVEVVVQYNQTRGFSSIWGSDSIPISARSIARAQASNWNATILTLSPTANTSLNLTGGSTMTVPQAVIVDSSATTAANLSGSNTQLVATQIEVVGGISPSSGSGYSPTPVTGSKYYTADPLSSLAPPSTSSLVTRSTSALTYKSGSTTLDPGIYQGGITIQGGATVTLNPGIYYLEGGGLTVSANTTTLSGTGVMIYNGETGGSTTDPSTVGSINISSSAVVTLSPMSSGTYQGISIFQDRNATTNMTIKGGGGTNITGMLYAPAAPVTITGGSDNIPGTAFISSTLDIKGNSSFTIPTPPIPVPVSNVGNSVGLVE